MVNKIDMVNDSLTIQVKKLDWSYRIFFVVCKVCATNVAFLTVYL